MPKEDMPRRFECEVCKSPIAQNKTLSLFFSLPREKEGVDFKYAGYICFRCNSVRLFTTVEGAMDAWNKYYGLPNLQQRLDGNKLKAVMPRGRG